MTREKQNYPPEKPDPALNATKGQRRLGGVTGKGFLPTLSPADRNVYVHVSEEKSEG
jgi:hypothetical protein